jgi:hypothetical protein
VSNRAIVRCWAGGERGQASRWSHQAVPDDVECPTPRIGERDDLDPPIARRGPALRVSGALEIVDDAGDVGAITVHTPSISLQSRGTAG